MVTTNTDDPVAEAGVATISASAREELGRAWLSVLRARHADVAWTLRPPEGLERNAMTAPRKIGRTFASPEDERALLDRLAT